MSWNYRVMRTFFKKECVYEFAIHEVYYNKRGKPEGHTDAVYPNGKDYAELTRDFALYQKAFSMPTLEWDSKYKLYREVGFITQNVLSEVRGKLKMTEEEVKEIEDAKKS